MRKFFAFSIFLITLYSVVFAAAAALDVEGGTLQVFAQPISIQALVGTSLEASLSAAGFRQQGEEGDHAGVSGEACVTNSGEQATQGLAITIFVEIRQGWGASEIIPASR